MSHRDHKEPNEFSQKIRHEGKAGFGSGPWSDPAKIDVKTRPAVIPPGNNRTRPGSQPVQPGKRTPCFLGDRILTGLAILSLGMMIVGAMGAYLSNDSQRVATTTRNESIGLQQSPDARFVELERRLTQLNDLYGERFHSLESKIAQATDPYEARLTQVERRLDTSGDTGAIRSQDTGTQPEQFNASSYEARLTTIENRLDQAYAPYHAELREMENRMGQGYASYDARLREIENRLMQIQVPYEQRLQALEQRLIYASARLDYLSSEMESLINTTGVIEADAALQANPPAALPVAASREAPTNSAGSQRLQPLSSMENAAATDTDTGNPVAPAPESASNEVTSPAIPPTPADIAPDRPATGESMAVMTETPKAGGMIAPPSQTDIAQAESLHTQARPVEANQEIRQENPPHQTGTGDWVINLASYASESIAAQKLADFGRKGVTAEQSEASVNGKTIYRVRITGFETRTAATVRAESIRQQLGLKETWITRH